LLKNRTPAPCYAIPIKTRRLSAMKHNIPYKLAAALMLALTLIPVSAAYAKDAPVITVKSAPMLAGEGVGEKQATRAVKGKVTLNGLKARDCAIIAFIDNGQWIKPYWDGYLTKVKSGGSLYKSDFQ